MVCAFAMGPRVEVQQEGPPPAARTTETTQRMVANQQTTDGWTHASISETFQSERPRLPHHKNTNKNKIALTLNRDGGGGCGEVPRLDDAIRAVRTRTTGAHAHTKLDAGTHPKT